MATFSKRSAGDADLLELRAFGLAFPGAHLKTPWPGHEDVAVNDKIFVHLSVGGEPFAMSCKLPHSANLALAFPFAKPTGYGLGKSGWVSVTFPRGASLPVAMFKEWIEESYRAIAPKRSVAALDAERASTSVSTKKIATTKTPTKKTPTKKVSAKKVAKKKVAKKKGATKTTSTPRRGR
ncbi:MAG: MmcQ/YjbR family DNA-binding protein [Polyangiaceae bacterium]